MPKAFRGVIRFAALWRWVSDKPMRLLLASKAVPASRTGFWLLGWQHQRQQSRGVARIFQGAVLLAIEVQTSQL